MRRTTSFEVRAQVGRPDATFSRGFLESPKLPSAESTISWTLLDDDSFTVRSGAAERLKWLARNPAMMCPLLEAIELRLADANCRRARQQLDPLWTKFMRLAVERFVEWNFAPVSAERIAIGSTPWPSRFRGHDGPLRRAGDGRPRTSGSFGSSRYGPGLDPCARGSAGRSTIGIIGGRAIARYTIGAGRDRGGILGKPIESVIQHLLVGIPSLPPGGQFSSQFTAATIKLRIA